MTENSTSPVPFFHFVEHLKRVKREGWRRFGIDDGESIADHMYRMSIIAMMAPKSLSHLDIPRCTKMALVHDMAEALVGDITPADNIPKTEKHAREEETMNYVRDRLLANVDGGECGRALKAAWQEYEDDKTDEAHFVHDVDKIELVLQMVEYERDHPQEPDLSEFLPVAGRIVLPEMRKWRDELLEERRKMWEERGSPSIGEKVDTVTKQQQDQYYGQNKKGVA